MIFLNSEEKTLAKAYNNMLVNFIDTYNKHPKMLLPCKDYATKRISAMGRIFVQHPLEEPRISLCGIHDPHSLQQYVMEMVDGILDFEVEKGNWKYTYHNRMVNPVNQIQFVIDELKRDRYSRRAIISIRTPDDIGSNDPACLQTIQFLFDGDALNMYVTFRSNDLAKATFMNAFALIKLGEYISEEVRLPFGSYTHIANDMHIYVQDLYVVNTYYYRIKNSTGNKGCTNYKDDWEELMLDEIYDIKEMVKELEKNEVYIPKIG
jgi:thymidylate synthase